MGQSGDLVPEGDGIDRGGRAPKRSRRSIAWWPATPLVEQGPLVSDAILRRIRPEQFREVILLVVTIGLLLFFASQIPNYFNPRSVNRLTTGSGHHRWSSRSGRCWSS